MNKKTPLGAGLNMSKQTKRDGLNAYQHRVVIMKMMMVVAK
jgi:hypothetical protein